MQGPMVAAAALAIAASIFFAAAIGYYFRENTMRATSPAFSIVMCFGGILTAVSVILESRPPTLELCNATAWTFCLGFALMCTYRTHPLRCDGLRCVVLSCVALNCVAPTLHSRGASPSLRDIMLLRGAAGDLFSLRLARPLGLHTSPRSNLPLHFFFFFFLATNRQHPRRRRRRQVACVFVKTHRIASLFLITRLTKRRSNTNPYSDLRVLFNICLIVLGKRATSRTPRSLRAMHTQKVLTLCRLVIIRCCFFPLNNRDPSLDFRLCIAAFLLLHPRACVRACMRMLARMCHLPAYAHPPCSSARARTHARLARR